MFTGCDQQSAEDSFSTKRKEMLERVNAKSDAEQAEKRKIVADDARSLLPAKSKEDLATAYQIAFDRGDIIAMEQMAVFRGDVSDKIRQSFVETGLGTLRAGESHVTNHTFEPPSEAATFRYPGQEIVSMLAIDTRSNDDSGSSSTTLPVVIEDDAYVFLFFVAPQNSESEE